ncbi:hypothetical protein JOC55_001400 [Paenibacillus sacheonensis]|nr:hypothetical protein [Paenibacillus sacheonensis]
MNGHYANYATLETTLFEREQKSTSEAENPLPMLSRENADQK